MLLCRAAPTGFKTGRATGRILAPGPIRVWWAYSEAGAGGRRHGALSRPDVAEGALSGARVPTEFAQLFGETPKLLLAVPEWRGFF